MFVTHKAENSVEYVTSDIIVSRHAFATRTGGVSANEHTFSLNLAFNRGDERGVVLENLSRFGAAVGFDPQSVISVPQIHSATVLDVDISMRGLGYRRETELSADGYVTSEKGVVLGVKSADCVSIILEAENQSGEIIAVCALHAGWRGTVAGIALQGVKKLVERGADPKRIRAAIGPSIGSCCFEVGEDFSVAVAEARGKEFCEKFVFSRNCSLYADIKAMNRELLLFCGLSHENVDVCHECTFCLEEKYYSHRRMGGKRGTMLSVVWL